MNDLGMKSLDDKIKVQVLKNGKIVKSYYRVWETSFGMKVTDMFSYKYEIGDKEFNDHFELNAYLNK